MVIIEIGPNEIPRPEDLHTKGICLDLVDAPWPAVAERLDLAGWLWDGTLDSPKSWRPKHPFRFLHLWKTQRVITWSHYSNEAGEWDLYVIKED
jgi:hypothetical protein